MADQGNVGNGSGTGAYSKGTPTDLRLDASAALVTTDGHAKYQEAVMNGNMFLSSNQAAQTLTGLATTVTGYCLTNPVGSGKNLVLIDATFAYGGAPAGANQVGYAYNASATAVTHTTPETVRNCLLPGNGTASTAGATSVAKVDNSSTTPTAGVSIRLVAGTGTSAITTIIPPDYIDGRIILSPGSYLHMYMLTTAPTTWLTAMTWEEIGLVVTR